ncbi:3-deoxy-D-manno-octulosonic acid transferase [Carboxylicivirga mesophila]|uniref:3-deoxy-D-manno-octulosonic acid transferase n=1 Tax=Carboxylicivirga mesophila TaxID=1166478 RepID=A0ABS5K6S8_9BACT|nr:glycosyltransferase N-terminal domain-containing protein [Carboxylicivirga mesophila]MBS2210233.1 3-deoxy-D-manno-octulosonic acid transferase [Carboxylicivirga mesophila]
MTLLYNIGIGAYSIALKLLASFNVKAKLLQEGRKETQRRLKELRLEGKVVWIHAASLGEFEQGRPIIEKIKEQHPDYKVVLTFFSPSGYEVRKNFDLADHVLYLPADTRRNAKAFIQAVNPEKVFFIKYEFWHHFLRELAKCRVPVYGVSMIFRKEQTFFKSYGGWFRNMLKTFDKLYVQDEMSGNLLAGIGINNYSVAGDTRFDRVRTIAGESKDFELIERFVASSQKVIVAGSTWAPDEDVLINYIQKVNNGVKLIIAPHEIHREHIKQIEDKLNVPFFRYTEGATEPDKARVLIVDTIGMLSSIYKYGQVAYIGGGFGVGIHNTLEAATYGMSVLFGPNYRKFKEARDLIECKGGFSVKDANEFNRQMESLWDEPDTLKAMSANARQYVDSMCGATSLIMAELFDKD